MLDGDECSSSGPSRECPTRVLFRTSAVKTTVETTVVSSQVAPIVLRLVISIEECTSWPPSELAVVAKRGVTIP